jgi:hypothetical protein
MRALIQKDEVAPAAVVELARDVRCATGPAEPALGGRVNFDWMR